MIQYISMILGMAVVIYLMIKGWNPIIIGIAASAVVIFLNGLSYSETMMGTFFPAFSGMFLSLFPPIFSGSLLAQVYNRSGAVETIANKMIAFLLPDLEQKKGVWNYAKVVLGLVVVCGTIAYCGMNCLVVLIVMYPIALRLMEKAGIPKRFVMGILSGGVYTFALGGPGSAEVLNVLAMQASGTPSYAGLVGGTVAALTEIAVMTLVMSVLIKRAVDRGETFELGPNDLKVRQKSDSQNCPGMLLSILPLLVMIGLFNLCEVDIFTATIVAWLLSVLFFWPQLSGMKDLMDICSEGAKGAFPPVSSVGAFVGFTAIIQSLPNFQVLMDGIFALKVPAALILILAIALVAGLTGSSSSAVRIGIPLVLERCQAAGLSRAFVHRVSCFAATTIDTMPWSTAVIINLNISDLKLKDAYPPMFVSTCLATICGTIVCAVVMYLFPMLP